MLECNKNVKNKFLWQLYFIHRNYCFTNFHYWNVYFVWLLVPNNSRLRVEVSPEIKDRGEVEIATGWSTKRPSTFNDICILFYLQAVHKKKSDMNSFIFFCCSYLNDNFSNLQFSNFKVPVIPSSLAILLVPTWRLNNISKVY
jgi:hypothetical protein